MMGDASGESEAWANAGMQNREFFENGRVIALQSIISYRSSVPTSRGCTLYWWIP